MKETYFEAKLEIIHFEAEDVITTSGNPGLDEDEMTPMPVGMDL